MSKNESKALFSLLDMWASYFVSRECEVCVPVFVAKEFCDQLRAIQLGDEFQEVISSLEVKIAEGEVLELTNDSKINKILFKLFSTQVSQMPEEGRVILANCRKYFDNKAP